MFKIIKSLCDIFCCGAEHVVVLCVQICTVIQEIFPDGAVSRDGRLKPGDQILEVRDTRHSVFKAF